MSFFDDIKGGGRSKFTLFTPQSTQSAPQSEPQPQTQLTPPVKEEVTTKEQNRDASGIYDDRLEKLIDAALADGELTEKEKQVLFKRAEAMGIDLDEFEMVLDSRLYERTKQMKQQATAASVIPPVTPTSAPTSNKYGDVKKCPSCGAMIETYTTRCPDCGFEFRGVEANVSIQKLFHMLNEVDENVHRLQMEKREKRTTLGRFLADLDDWDDTGDNNDAVLAKKKEIINLFPIPTTKDDILEFLVQAVPLARKPGLFSQDETAKEMYPVWRAKCEQIIMKAKFSMRDDKQTLEMIKEYADELKIKM